MDISDRKALRNDSVTEDEEKKKVSSHVIRKYYSESVQNMAKELETSDTVRRFGVIGGEGQKEKESDRKPETIKLPWYAQVKYAALLMVGVLIAMYFINEYQYSQTEDIIRARLKKFYGKVEIERGGEAIPAQKDMQLHNNDRIRTQSDASAVMEYTEEKTRVEISQHTDVRIRKDKG